MALNPQSSVPLYLQLKALLHEQMRSGAYAEGARLPSERELASQYGVSRMTARQALQLLAQEGWTYARVGKGTYVSAPKIPQELHSLSSFTEEMARLGMKASSRILRAEVRHAPPDIARILHVPPNTEIAVLSRVRLADERPMALETTHLVHARCPGVLDADDLNRHSLYDVLRQRYGITLAWAEQKIEARLPVNREVELLEMGGQTPVLLIERTTYDASDQAVEFVRSIYRGDRYQFRATLRGIERAAVSEKDGISNGTG